MQLVPVPSDAVAGVWAVAIPFIASACRKGPGSLRPEDLKTLCEVGKHQLWIARDEAGETRAAAITGIYAEDTRKVCEWVTTGGIDPSTWLHMNEPIEQWAKDQGCAAMRSYSRPGMKRLLPRSYRVKGIIFEKDLTRGQ